MGDFPVVGVGASAGGLAAFEAFFSAMPTDAPTGMAFVLVQHLAPDHKSILTELIGRYTSMAVHEVEDGVEVQPDCAYIIPPNRDMAFLNGTLHLLEPASPRGLRMPIDFFFRSLAQDLRERAICVVLSGMGSDGTQGLRAIKGEGGLVMVQEPESAGFDGMPRSAIATGLVDFVLAPGDMPSQLLSYAAHASRWGLASTAGTAPGVERVLGKICILLRGRTGHDFSEYKTNTLVRRVERRMAIHQIEVAEGYLRLLQAEPAELDALFADLLIGVTSFFRDPEAFETLQRELLPELLADKRPEDEVRVWVPGCSTGEEAYSLAILIQEHLEARNQRCSVQIFATDIDRVAVERARAAVFPVGIIDDVGEERLARFFIREKDHDTYRVNKNIRDHLIFSEQDVTKDPPFSRMDLISCRNMLIYMNAGLQKRLIPLFHYALNPSGALFLGSSETVGEHANLFSVVSRKWQIYRRKASAPGASRPAFGSFVSSSQGDRLASRAARGNQLAAGPVAEDLRAVTVRAMMAHYAQVGVLVDGRGDVLHIHGRTGKFLEPAPGDAGMNILAMARDGLRQPLATAIHKASTHRSVSRHPGLRVRTNGDSVVVDLVVTPVAPGGDDSPELFLVLIEEAPLDPVQGEAATERDVIASASATDARLSALERDLRAKEEYLQTTLEELETSNEELRSSNEEMQSVNEELQSTNEELETSKEEMQSVNEELATVNAELQTKVVELTRANNDMNNLLAGTGVGTLFVDHQLRINRFTPAAKQVINLIPGDVGRPVGHVVSNLVGYDRLVEDVGSVLDTLTPIEAEVQTAANIWYLMSIRPYRTLENVIEGAVITFVDITAAKRTENALQRTRELSENIVQRVREPLLVLDQEMRVVLTNEAFCELFRIPRRAAEGQHIYELGDGQWDVPAFRELLEDVIPKRRSFDDHEMTLLSVGEEPRTIRVSGRKVGSENGDDEQVLLVLSDPTGGSRPEL